MLKFWITTQFNFRKVRTGFLHVEQIDMPPDHNGVCRTYANVIDAYSVVMMLQPAKNDECGVIRFRRQSF